MEIERWHRVEQLFHSARQLAVSQQAEFLASACGSDPAMRNEVESLLAAESEAGDLLNRNVMDLMAEASRSADLIGKKLGAYQITELLGRGGMGEVYVAKDTRLPRQVAIKLLLPAIRQDHKRLQRFATEVTSASTLNHPNVVTILDLGTFQSAPYIVTEFVDGQTLRKRLEQSPIPLTEALEIAVQVAAALAAAHTAGIIHRDIKPENVMIRRDRLVKVLDFGLAKLLEREAPWTPDTDSGHVIGTPHYMGPLRKDFS
jgi:eukaryotic-like serine/threonine-protein kinase